MENIVRKGEIACNKQFLLFSRFLPYMAAIFHFKCTLKCRLQFVSIWTSKILSSGNGLNSSKLKKLAEDNFKCKENGRKFFKQVENTERKGEIAHYEQFFLFPQCFQKLVLQTHRNQGLFRKELKS